MWCGGLWLKALTEDYRPKKPKFVQILPTNDYLKRYRVKDSNICEKCNLEFDSIEHSLYSCSEIVQTLTTFFQFLKVECEINVDFGMIQYLMGFSGNENI